MPEPEATPESSAGESTDSQKESYLNDFQNDAKPADSTSSAATEDAKPSDSSPDDGAKEPKSSLEVVQAAMQATDGESPTPGATDQAANAAQSDTDKPEADGEKSTDEKPPFHDHPRWQEMLTVNKDLKAEVEQLKPLEEPASRYTKLNNYLIENDLNGQDFQNMLNIGVAMKTDPEKALEMIQPYYDVLLKLNGKIIPDDIQDMITKGTIDEHTGQTMAVERARNAQLETKLQREKTKRGETEEAKAEIEKTEAVKALSQAIEKTVTEWESKWSQADADYPTLMPLVRDKVLIKLQQDPAKSPEEALKACEEARNEVIELFKKVKPAPKPMNTTGQSGVNTGQAPTTKPESGLEVVQASLAS